MSSAGTGLADTYARAARGVFFETDCEEFLYATHGGTAFLVRVRNRLYALTCGHVIVNFDVRRIFLTRDFFGVKGTPPAPVAEYIRPTNPTGGAVDSDVLDLRAIRIDESVAADFFRDAPYIISEDTVTTSLPGEIVEVFGVLNDKTNIIPPDMEFSFARLHFQDVGHYKGDPVLCEARTKITNPDITNLDGLSGGPVFNLTQGRLCGMALRGGIVGGDATLFYLDAHHILRFLENVIDRNESASYVHNVLVRTESRLRRSWALETYRRSLLNGALGRR
jgi:hypothetical protein